MHGLNQAEVAILIRDDFQRRGLGTGLMERLLQVARDENISRVVAFMLPDNIGMQKLAVHVGLTLDPMSDPDLLVATRTFASKAR
jgi:acetyltransferase